MFSTNNPINVINMNPENILNFIDLIFIRTTIGILVFFLLLYWDLSLFI
jgi:hypothetical protein